MVVENTQCRIRVGSTGWRVVRARAAATTARPDSSEALAAYAEARALFEAQNEPASVAIAWHQIGMVHQAAGHYGEAEAAYRRSLEIRVRNNLRGEQAASLNQLGNLYNDHLNRPEEAVIFYRQAADLYVERV